MIDPTVLTVILNYRTPEMALDSAAAAVRAMDGIKGEILIVDNASPDDSYELILATLADANWNREGRVRVVQSGHNGGFGAGNNFGMQTGLSSGEKPDFYYLLNSDAFPNPKAIIRLRDFLTAYPRAGLAGGQSRGLNGELQHSAFRFPSIASEFETGAKTGFISRLLKNSRVSIPIPDADTQVDWVEGSNLMLRRQMLDEIGMFDEIFFLYFEETELCFRAAQAGWRAYFVPSSEVLHIGSASTGMKSWSRTPQYWFDSRCYFYTKNHGAAYMAATTLARIAGCVIWRVRRVSPNKPLGDPPMFLRDLVTHSIRVLFGRTPQKVAPDQLPATQAVMEDQK
ncbi:MAG: glycosyl transferase [Rhodobacteraceae bacterium]|nr:MAG: glycosyl transferase [Paracoccaceae bacterium]